MDTKSTTTKTCLHKKFKVRKSPCELRDTLISCLENKRNKLINQVVIKHHNSEFRRQFKTKPPTAFDIVMREAEHDKCKDIANSTHWKVPKETLDAITDKKTTT